MLSGSKAFPLDEPTVEASDAGCVADDEAASPAFPVDLSSWGLASDTLLGRGGDRGEAGVMMGTPSDSHVAGIDEPLMAADESSQTGDPGPPSDEMHHMRCDDVMPSEHGYDGIGDRLSEMVRRDTAWAKAPARTPAPRLYAAMRCNI